MKDFWNIGSLVTLAVAAWFRIAGDDHSAALMMLFCIYARVEYARLCK